MISIFHEFSCLAHSERNSSALMYLVKVYRFDVTTCSSNVNNFSVQNDTVTYSQPTTKLTHIQQLSCK